jgi:hypothetical protein
MFMLSAKDCVVRTGVVVMLDLVDPERVGRWPRHLRRQARFDEAGEPMQHKVALGWSLFWSAPRTSSTPLLCIVE